MQPRRAALLCLLQCLLAASFCYGGDRAVDVVGVGECVDCASTNIDARKAFTGLRVTIECRSGDGLLETRGGGELDGDGRFRASLPAEMAGEWGLKQECFAQLHGASAAPCAARDSSRIVLLGSSDGRVTFGPAGRLRFSPATCTSALLWPFFKNKPLPEQPLMPKIDPWKKKPFPKVPLPPLKGFGHHPFLFPPKHKMPCPPHIPKTLPPPVPIYKSKPPLPIYKPKPPVPVNNPSPPPSPVYTPNPPVPVNNPTPPPSPVYKPKPPVPLHKPNPPPVPIYKPNPPKVPSVPPLHKKPCPPVPILPKPPLFPKIRPIHKPLPKVPNHPPIPKIPPLHNKPLPPIPKIPILPKPPLIPELPPFHKKPCPPLPNIPGHPKLLPFPPVHP